MFIPKSKMFIFLFMIRNIIVEHLFNTRILGTSAGISKEPALIVFPCRLCKAEWSCFAECNVAWKLAFTFYEPLIASVCEPSSNMEKGSTGTYGLSDQLCLVLISWWAFPSICEDGSLDCHTDGFAQQRCFRKLKSIHGMLWQQQKEFIYGL